MKKEIIKVDIEPIGKRIILEEPKNGLEAIIDAGIGLKSVCAGKGTCGKCRIIISDKIKSVPTQSEIKVLSQDEINRGVRLACQQLFAKNTTIYIPASSLTEEQKLQVSGKEEKIEVDPVCRKYFLKLNQATLKDMKSDFSRIKDSARAVHGIDISSIDYRVLMLLPSVIRENSWEITVTVRDGEIIFAEGGDKTKKCYGIAVDLGTTKIAILLVDLITGGTIVKKGVMNPQISFGEDVMSRINFAMQSKENTSKIQNAVIEILNRSIEELALENNIRPDEIVEMTLVGNTAMHHLFLGLPVRQLGLSPFVPLTDKELDIKAREIGITIAPGAYIYLLPVVAGYVGSDHVAMVLATGIYRKQGNLIGIDIGTNTEIALKSSKGMESVSTASGPAFEGAHISYGMRAAPGAIERVTINPKSCAPAIQTINDKKPVGICGSGILDAIAEFLKAGIIDKKGKFISQSPCLSRDDKGILQYLFDKETKVSINQKDIVEIQLAKSAIRTGIEILLESANLKFDDIDGIVIAGAFGSYIDPRNVINIGMFPNIPLKKIIQVGNAAGVGAKMVLISGKERKIAEEIARKINYIELTVFPTFSDNFIKSTLFPNIDEIV